MLRFFRVSHGIGALTLALGVVACSGGSSTPPVASIGSANHLVRPNTVNLLTNGSFETGDLTGWTGHHVPPASQFPCISFNNPGMAATEPTGGLSPDPVGTYYLVCRANPSNESYTQKLQLAQGVYAVGFTAYPYSYQNPDNAKVTAAIGTTVGASINTANAGGDQWHLKTGNITINSAGLYTFRLKFKCTGTVGRDIVVDRVYVVQVN